MTPLEEIVRIAKGESKHVSDTGRLITIARLANEMLASERPRLPFAPIEGPAIDGDTYEAPLDEVRLRGQFALVWDAFERARRRLVRDEWMTLGELHNVIRAYHRVDISEASISARLRDFRKPRYGAHRVERRRRGDPRSGLFEYQIIPREAARVSWLIQEE